MECKILYKYLIPGDHILQIFVYLRNQYFMKGEKLTRTDLVVSAHRINGKNYIDVRLPFENIKLKSSRVPQLTCIWMSGASGLGKLTT